MRDRSLVNCSAYASECRDRIQRRSGPSPNRKRRSRQQELPSFAGSGRSAQRFKIAIVEQVDAQRYQREVVNRADNRGGRDILWVVGRQQGDILFLQPRNHRGVEAGIFAAWSPAAQIWPKFLPARPYTGADEEGVTGLDLQSSLFQPRFDILDIDRSARLEILDSFHHRDVDQNSTGENSILQVVYRILCVTVRL